MNIADKQIGPGHPVYIVAEIGANHGGSYDQAVKLVEAAAACGADAAKLQTFTPDTMTIDCDRDEFKIKSGLWSGRTLYDLYREAAMPWEWQPKLKKIAESLGIALFSTPFDETAVDFLEMMDVPAYKIASFELTDHALLKKVAATGKPVILSTGMATFSEIDEAVQVLSLASIALLKCTSAYPAPLEEVNLRAIPEMQRTWSWCPVGISDHTLGITVPIAAVAIGACIVEKHLKLRGEQKLDGAFSLDPVAFREMVDAVRATEKVLGRADRSPTASFGPTPSEHVELRRSLWVVKDVKKGEAFTSENVRAIRPGGGLPPEQLDEVLGYRAVREVPRGTPMTWDVVL